MTAYRGPIRTSPSTRSWPRPHAPFVKEAAARCTVDPGTLVTILTGVALSLDPVVKVDPTQGAFGHG